MELKRLTTMTRSFGLEMHVISAAEARDLFPLMDPSGVLGAAYIPSDGHVDPASLCQAIARAARQRGATIHERPDLGSRRRLGGGRLQRRPGRRDDPGYCGGAPAPALYGRMVIYKAMYDLLLIPTHRA